MFNREPGQQAVNVLAACLVELVARVESRLLAT